MPAATNQSVLIKENFRVIPSIFREKTRPKNCGGYNVQKSHHDLDDNHSETP